MRRRRTIRVAALLIALGLLGLVGADVYRLTRSKAGMTPLPADGRVRFELGAEHHAATVAAALDDALATVERGQLRPFRKAPAIFVCASQASFNRRTRQRPGHRGRGLATADAVFVSPRTFSFAFGDGPPVDTHRALLAHELSHSHLMQHLGALGFRRRLPRWFQEGLAVWTSGGGGAEPVPPAAAVRAACQGTKLVPDDRGRWLGLRAPRSYGLSHHMLYAQGALLVGNLASDAPAFRTLLDALYGGAAFGPAVERAYGRTIGALWRDFLAARCADR